MYYIEMFGLVFEIFTASLDIKWKFSMGNGHSVEIQCKNEHVTFSWHIFSTEKRFPLCFLKQ